MIWPQKHQQIKALPHFRIWAQNEFMNYGVWGLGACIIAQQQ